MIYLKDYICIQRDKPNGMTKLVLHNSRIGDRRQYTEVDVKSPERQDIISDNAPPMYLNYGLITRRDCT